MGLLYTRTLLGALATVWGGAVAGSSIRFHATAQTLGISSAASLIAAAAAMWLTLRRQGRASAASLLAGGAELELKLSSGRLGRPAIGLIVGLFALLAAAGVTALGWGQVGQSSAGAFFGAGGMLLVACLALSQALIALAGRRARMTLDGMGFRNAARRPGRSLTTTALLACGIFLVVSVGVFRKDAGAEAGRRDGGAGGFALLAESTLPVLYDLNDPAGRRDFGLDEADLTAASVVPMRLRAGDDASCLNLNRAQRPPLLGVDPEALASRGAFSFLAVADGYDLTSGWRVLDERRGDEVPVVADQATIVWALGRKVGDTIGDDGRFVDEHGKPFKLRLVGMIGDSVLQGSLLIANRDFERLFPSASGYQRLLIDAPVDASEDVAAALSRAGEDIGLQVTPTTRRLAEFNVVQNTYLSIFQVLGGLGLLLGTVGLGVVLLRNVLQRRGELALMRAVGFSRGHVEGLLLSEHWLLLALGLVGGAASGLLATAPMLVSSGGTGSADSLTWTLLVIGIGGMVWTLLATRAALRGPLMASLRKE